MNPKHYIERSQLFIQALSALVPDPLLLLSCLAYKLIAVGLLTLFSSAQNFSNIL